MHRIETHAHTRIVSPCGRLSPAALVKGYLRAGYDGLIITDHLVHSLPIFRFKRSWKDRVRAYFSGFRAVEEAARGTRLTVYPGMELTFADMRGYDFLVFGIEEDTLAALPDLCHMDLPKFRHHADSAGALVFQAHPFRGLGPAPPGLLDGVEVYNGNPRHDSRDDRAEAFAASHGLLRSSGSDAHLRGDLGRGGIALPELPATIHDLVRFYREAPEEIGLLGLDHAVDAAALS